MMTKYDVVPYVPWTIGKFPTDRSVYIREKLGEHYYLIVNLGWEFVGIMEGSTKRHIKYEVLLRNWIQANGEPCGCPQISKGEQ